MRNIVIMSELELAKKVETEEGKYYNPDGEIYFSVEESPVICLVCHAEELESECYLDESHYDLHCIEPAATALSQILEKRREESKECERKGECKLEC